MHGAGRNSRVFSLRGKRSTASNVNCENGATTVEVIVIAWILLLAFLLCLQLGMIYHAKLVLNYAVFEAARKGAVNHAQISAMRDELGIRLAPLYGGDGSADAALLAMASSSLETNDRTTTRLTIINPTSAAFDDWAVQDPVNRRRIIPNAHLRDHSTVVGTRSGLSLQDANLLKLQVEYGVKLGVPIAGAMIARLMTVIQPQKAAFYVQRKLPLTSVATVRMQSSAWES